MASTILTLKSFLASKHKCASTRGFCKSSIHYLDQQLGPQLDYLKKSSSPSVVTLETSFFAPDNREIHNSCRRGSGVFLDPTSIVTSAHVVGRVATSYESKTVEKPDRFEHGRVLHKSYIGSSVALTGDPIMLTTKLLAVSFANDVAVLKVVMPEKTLFPHCSIANSQPCKEDFLMAFADKRYFDFSILLGTVRAIGEKTIRAKAPWPLDNESEWMEHDWFISLGGNPPPESHFFNSREMVTGSITRVTGSPWFNLNGEVVGISSWEAIYQPAQFSVGFAVPPLCIRAVVDYAKTKRPEDPIVMDSWIEAHMIPEIDDDNPERSN